MFHIRADQVQYLGAIPRLNFERVLIDFLAQHYAREVNELGESQTRVVVRAAIAHAEAMNLRSQQDVVVVLALRMLLGAGFDTDPQLPWISTALREGGPRGAWRSTLNYLREVCGERHEHLVPAMVRLRNHFMHRIPATEAEVESDALSRLFHQLYPRKWEAQPPDATERIIEEARVLADEHDMMTPAGVAVLGVMGFWMGADVYTDPAFPWIAQHLQPCSESPAERVDGLRKAALSYLAHALRQP